MVDGGVEAELAGEHGALLVAPGNADDPAARELRQLPDDMADRSAGGRDDHRLPGLWAADVEQAEVGGEAVGPEGAEVQGRVTVSRDTGEARSGCTE